MSEQREAVLAMRRGRGRGRGPCSALLTLISVIHGLITPQSILKTGSERDAQMEAGEAVAIVTTEGKQTPGAGGAIT